MTGSVQSVVKNSNHLHAHRQTFPAADADGRHAALESALLQRREQRHENPRARATDGMAKRNRPAADIELFMRHAILMTGPSLIRGRLVGSATSP